LRTFPAPACNDVSCFHRPRRIAAADSSGWEEH
jgi:hypothetical protein